ncbi:MAG TPA: class I SAM-dependent methyltransferase, partial [Polyangiaceae bacterium]|nr:class I SAM-dependent methyltransferase [Polyangiaceae bacterium]
ERVDVDSRVPKTKEECEHYARYVWASAQVHGEVLDVACGTGYGSRLLARCARVSGVDRNQDAVETARSRTAGRFLVADVPPIPFADDAFDFVVSFETIEHIPNDVEFIGEIRRVLRPGGTLLISTPNGDISAPGGVPLNRWHVREYTLTSLTTLLGEAGLQVCDLHAQSFPPRVSRGHRITWRLHGLTWTQPARVRQATRAVFGDAEVHPRTHHQPAPGYWIARARERKIAGGDGPSAGRLVSS